mmetsp:Transcript_25116/g.83780  ORF Transcript_25116/g.83780 Transcript_25116/m.83780 type:complete len:251 (-) Transcript_25116:1180-1932(-)
MDEDIRRWWGRGICDAASRQDEDVGHGRAVGIHDRGEGADPPRLPGRAALAADGDVGHRVQGPVLYASADAQEVGDVSVHAPVARLEQLLRLPLRTGGGTGPAIRRVALALAPPRPSALCEVACARLHTRDAGCKSKCIALCVGQTIREEKRFGRRRRQSRRRRGEQPGSRCRGRRRPGARCGARGGRRGAPRGVAAEGAPRRAAVLGRHRPLLVCLGNGAGQPLRRDATGRWLCGGVVGGGAQIQWLPR